MVHTLSISKKTMKPDSILKTVMAWAKEQRIKVNASVLTVAPFHMQQKLLHDQTGIMNLRGVSVSILVEEPSHKIRQFWIDEAGNFF
jgi:hypothetical protein